MDPLEELARVYADAEHALSLNVAREVERGLADEDAPTDTAVQLAAVRRLRIAAQDAVRGLNGRVPPIARRVLDEAAEKGSAGATAALGRLLGDPTDGEPFDRRRLDQLAAGVLDQITPAHASILRTVPDVYRDVIRRAAPGLLVGAQTRREAAQRAMAEYARRGVTGFTDRAGRRWELASYVEMALRTVAARTETDALVDRFRQAGQELVQVSDAPQECALCRPFEGKVLAIVGPAGRRRVPHHTRRTRVTVDVVATLDEARLRGFQHPNCRHVVVLYLPGVTKAPTGPGTGPDPEGDKARQRQRAIEREIRAYKRRASLALDEPARKAANAHVRRWQARMREHLAEHPELRRLSYREAPGIGNAPSADLLADPAGPFPDLLDAKRPNQLTDEELDEAMQAAIVAEDWERFDLLEADGDRRDAERRRREERNEAARARRAERALQREEEQARRLEELLTAGMDEEEAVADAYGVPIERQRRDAARARLIGNGYTGTWAQMTRAAFRDAAREQWLRAEDEAGFLTSREAQRRGIDPASLFTGAEARARRWASDELKEWWDRNGRLSYDAFVEGLVNGTGGAGSSGGDFLA